MTFSKEIFICFVSVSVGFMHLSIIPERKEALKQCCLYPWFCLRLYLLVFSGCWYSTSGWGSIAKQRVWNPSAFQLFGFELKAFSLCVSSLQRLLLYFYSPGLNQWLCSQCVLVCFLTSWRFDPGIYEPPYVLSWSIHILKAIFHALTV